MSTVDAPPSAGADLRLIAPAGVAWAAAWWATGADGPAAAWAAAAGCALAALLVLAAPLVLPSRPVGPARPPRRGRRTWAAAGPAVAVAGPAVALVAAAAAAVLTAGAGGLTARTAGPWPGWVAERAVVTLEGTAVTDAARVVGPPPVAGRPRPAAGADGPQRWTLRVDVDSATARGRTQFLGLPVLVVGERSWQDVTAGQRVRLVGRASPPRPGDEIAAFVSASGAPRDVREGGWPWRLADTLREALRQACVGLPERAGGLLPSLVVGDTSTLPEGLRAELSTAGMAHLTAVSGANLAIMAESALWVASALRWPRAVRLPLMVLTVVGFVVLARPSPSVLRAAAMGAVAVAAAGASRRPRGVPALCAAVVVLLVADPWLARSAGFALSVVATGALLLLAPPWAAALGRYLPRPAALALAAPAAAQVACAPVVLLLQPVVSVVAVPANLVAEPAVAPATVAGVLAALTGPWWPAGAHLLAVAGGVGTGWIALVAGTAARLPLASVPWPGGPAGALLLALLEGAVVVATLPSARRALRQRLSPGARGALLRPAAAAAAVLGLAAWFAGLAPAVPGRGGPPASWAVAMCDVGQGDATVLRTGGDRALLVDAGPDPSLVDGCLRRLGVRHLDLVVLTHFHADHVAGLPGALGRRGVGALLVSPLDEPAANAAAVARDAAGGRLRPVVAGPGQAGELGADGWLLRWRVVAAAADAGAGESEPEGTVVNEASVALDVTVHGPRGRVHVLLLGDLETQGQQGLARRLATGEVRLDGPVDVVKVAHHGSAKQVEDLYRRAGARLGLIGVGAGNDYGHPARVTLDLLQRTGTTVLRTDLAGDVVVEPGPASSLVVTTSR